jgi:hypothetical protein
VIDELCCQFVAFAAEELPQLAALVLLGLPPVSGRDTEVDSGPLRGLALRRSAVGETAVVIGAIKVTWGIRGRP